MFGLYEDCYEERKLVPVFPCEVPCEEEDYGDLIVSAIDAAKKARKIIERLFFIEDYCECPDRVCTCLKEAIYELKELRKYLDCLLQRFNPDYFKCDRAYPGLVRAFVISKFVLRLFCYLLTIDFCEDDEQLEFLINSLRRASIDADIFLNELYILRETYEGECM